MSLLDELEQIRRGGGEFGSQEYFETAQNKYLQLLAGKAPFEQSLRETMRARATEETGVQREQRRAREELAQVRPTLIAKYAAAEPGGRPLIRPEDLTALIAGREAAVGRELQSFQDVLTQRVGTREEAIASALSGYQAEAATASELARAAESAYERRLSAEAEERRLAAGAAEATQPSLSDILRVLGYQQEVQTKQNEARNLKNRIEQDVAETIKAGGYIDPEDVSGEPVPLDSTSDVAIKNLAARILRYNEKDYDVDAVSAVWKWVNQAEFLEVPAIKTARRTMRPLQLEMAAPAWQQALRWIPGLRSLFPATQQVSVRPGQ